MCSGDSVINCAYNQNFATKLSRDKRMCFASLLAIQFLGIVDNAG